LKFHEHYSLDHKLASKNVIQGLQFKWNFLKTRKMMNRDFPLHWYNWFENLPLIDVANIESIFHAKTTNR
jgi:hypothetical protein